MPKPFKTLARVRVGCSVCLVCAGGPLACGSDSDGAGPQQSSGGRAPVMADADEFVSAHNAVRAAVEQPANYPGTWQPLPPVSWSGELAATAQSWAEHLRDQEGCSLTHSSASGYGENLAGGTGTLTPTAVVAMWAEEKASYTFSAQYQATTSAGHYTQIVWRASVQIGCGSAACGNGAKVVCCRYVPPGNMIGQQPY